MTEQRRLLQRSDAVIKHLKTDPAPEASVAEHVNAAIRRVRYLGMYGTHAVALKSLGRHSRASFAFLVKKEARKLSRRLREYRAVFGPEAIVFVRVK